MNFFRLLLVWLVSAAVLAADPPVYERHAKHDPNGLGVFYLGRELAQVMGHQAANWLERPGREEEERTDLLIEALHLEPNQTVADIGAGTGYIAERMAQKVGEGGVVYGVDIQQEMLDLMARKLRKKGLTNIRPVLGTTTDPRLPDASIDLMIMVDVYHEFDKPYEMTQNMVRALKPGGRLVFVEYRKEDPKVAIKEVHKMTTDQVKLEMSVFPELTFVETSEILPQQHIIFFRKS